MNVNYRAQPGCGYARQRGVSLVELMIALALGAALIAGIIQVFTSNNAAFRLQQNSARVQENARFGFHFLATELRQAGFAGCGGSANNDSILDSSGDQYEYMFDYSKAVEGYDLSEESLPGDLPTLSKTPKANSEVFVIRRAGTGTLTAAENQPSNKAANFKTSELHDFDSGDILTISDCQNSWTFQVSNANQKNKTVVANKGKGTPGNKEKLTKAELGADWSISRSYAVFYYLVGASNSASGQPALYRQINEKDGEELVAGVENMELEYGLDTDIEPTGSDCSVEAGDGEVDKYKTAAKIDDTNCEWAQVVGARVSLLLRSQSDQVMPDGQTLQFAGTDETFNDGRLRHVMNTTITFRNKTR